MTYGIKASKQAAASGFERALPNNLDVPSSRTKGGVILSVARNVAVELSVPEFHI
jgi:hypothetical protein